MIEKSVWLQVLGVGPPSPWIDLLMSCILLGLIVLFYCTGGWSFSTTLAAWTLGTRMERLFQ